MAKAKPKKQVVKKGALTFDNIAGANAVFNEQEKVKDFVLVLRLKKTMYYKFKKMHYDFITEATGIDWDATSAKNYFKFILLELKKHLEKKGQYKVATKTFANSIYRKGRRRNGERSVSAKEAMHTSLGVYSDPKVKEIHLNICHSFSLLDDNEHFFEYSFLYFFYDIFEFMELHNERLIKENK